MAITPSRYKVRKRPSDLAGRIALYVRWVVYYLTFGRSGELPYTWELRHPMLPPPAMFKVPSPRHRRDLSVFAPRPTGIIEVEGLLDTTNGRRHQLGYLPTGNTGTR